MDTTLGKLQGKTNFTVALLDIFNIILRQEFFRQCHNMIDLYLQCMLVMKQEVSCMVPLVKIPKSKGIVYLLAMQILKGLKKGEPTFLATIMSSSQKDGAKETLPPCIEKMLEEHKDVMLDELPNTFTSKREVDHTIELEPRTRPTAYPPYCLAPPQLEELRKQLKDLLEVGLIRSFKVPCGVPVLFQKKKDVSLHLYIDYWELNKVIVKN